MAVLIRLTGVREESSQSPEHSSKVSDNRPLPPEIYQRRRIAAAIVILLVIGLLWWIISSITSGESNNSSQNSPVESSSTVARDSSTSKSPQPSASSSASEKKETSIPRVADGGAAGTAAALSAKAASASDSTSSPESTSETGKTTAEKTPESSSEPAKTDKAGADASAVRAAELAQKDSCVLEDLTITAHPGQPSFAPDTMPNFFLEIYNPTKGNCDIDLNKESMRFEVFALENYQRIWGDLDCNAPEATGNLTVEPGKTKRFELKNWSRTTSAPDQCTDRKPVPAGSYLLYTHIGSNTSEPAPFNLQ